jgi:hypothetical protein
VVTLVEETKKMNPALDERYARDLQDIEDDVKRRLPATQPGGPQSASGLSRGFMASVLGG